MAPEIGDAKGQARKALDNVLLGNSSDDVSADEVDAAAVSSKELEVAKLKAQDAVKNVLLGGDRKQGLEHVKEKAKDALFSVLSPAIDAHTELTQEELEAARERARDSLSASLYG